MEVRTVTDADAHAVRRVVRDAWHAGYDDVIGTEAVDEFLDAHYGDEQVDELVRDATENDDHLFFVATDDEDVVGVVFGKPVDDPGAFEVGNICVLSSYWGAGVGGDLLKRFERGVARRDGTQVTAVTMAESERTLSFYAGNGYRPVRRFRIPDGADHVKFVKEI